MIAALPWYPAAAPVLERLWDGVRKRLGFGPARLHWPNDLHAHWRTDPILLSQTCAPVWQRFLSDRLHVVGTLDFGVAAPGAYRSHLVARATDRRPLDALAARVAVNDFDSQSGWGALAPLPVGAAIVTGRHRASMAAVAAGEADLAAIDAVSWHLSPHPDLVIRLSTPPTPAPPLLTGDATMVAPLRMALAGAIAALPPADRQATGLRGFVPADAASYRDLALPPPAPRCIRRQTAA